MLCCDLVMSVKFLLLARPAMSVNQRGILLRLDQTNEKTAPVRLCAWEGSTCFQRKIIGVAGGIQINFISVVYWMFDWEEKRLRII